MEKPVPVRLRDGSKLFVRAESLTPSADVDEEQEIAGRMPSLDQVASAVAGFAESIGESLKRVAPKRFTVEFECEIAMDAGTLVAIIGKASAKSAFRVTMEWET